MFGHWPRAEEMAGVPLALAAGNNPVAAVDLPPQEDRTQLRQALGLPQDAFIAIRLGPARSAQMERSADPSWRAAAAPICRGFISSSFRRPPSRHGVIRRLMGARVTLAPFTTERATVARYLAASDAMLHYARYGESFGYAMAEAALAGLPVIAQATPWGDNAQAELIRDGETGFLVDDYAAARRALERLSGDPDFARALAAAAAADIAARFGVAATWRLLTAFIEHALAGGRGLIEAPVDLAEDQHRRLAAGIGSYGAAYPLAAAHGRRTAALYQALVLAPRAAGRGGYPEAAAGAMNVLMFLHDAYGGLGGISRNNRDVLDALVA